MHHLVKIYSAFSVVMLGVVMLSVFFLIGIPNDVMLFVIMLSVMAPKFVVLKNLK
jgi:hypothetical protein